MTRYYLGYDKKSPVGNPCPTFYIEVWAHDYYDTKKRVRCYNPRSAYLWEASGMEEYINRLFPQGKTAIIEPCGELWVKPEEGF